MESLNEGTSCAPVDGGAIILREEFTVAVAVAAAAAAEFVFVTTVWC